MLCNVNIVGHKKPEDIELENGIIKAISSNNKSSGTSHDKTIYFKDAIAFPGLINSHDHLDFNLFPQTGNGIYKNYTEWGRDIHSRNKEIINSVLKVPQHARTQSGIYKNLLNGFTTVVNHGEKLTIENCPINVIQNNHCLHSIRFEKNWRIKLNNIFSKHRPFVIHVGEGTDRAAHKEIDELIKWNLFKRKLIGVHGCGNG